MCLIGTCLRFDSLSRGKEDEREEVKEEEDDDVAAVILSLSL